MIEQQELLTPESFEVTHSVAEEIFDLATLTRYNIKLEEEDGQKEGESTS